MRQLLTTQCVFHSLGLPDELIQKGKDIKSISEIEENGDDFKVTVTTGTKVLVNSFTIGKEAELETITGERLKVSRTLDLTPAAVLNCEPQDFQHFQYMSLLQFSSSILWETRAWLDAHKADYFE